MIDRHALTLPARAYRVVDAVTKLAGVGLVAAGLEAGGATPAGLALGACGAALGLTTVFVGRRQ